jgi:SNF2 family DNA or RNA helicase
LKETKEDVEARETWLQALNPFDSSRICAAVHALRDIMVDPQYAYQKVAVFCDWLSPLVLLKKALETPPNKKFGNGKSVADLSHGILTFTGEDNQKTRNAALESFNNIQKILKKRKAPRIMLLTTRCGGSALNLVGANHAMLLNLPNTPTEANQAIGRVLRQPGQPHIIQWYHHAFDTRKWHTIETVYLRQIHQVLIGF